MGNHNSGRRPQPTALKLLRGNPSKTKPNPREPKPPAGPVAQPVELSVGARAVWAELAPVCVAMGTLTPADVRVFATMCELQSTLQRASAAKDASEAEALTVVLKLEWDTATAVRPYYALFGLEPVSRARVAVKPDEQKVSKWAGSL